MKKYFYLLSTILIIVLSSFVILKSPPKKTPLKAEKENLWGTCSKPNLLNATKNYNQIIFTWSNTAYACNVAGYYNFDSSGSSRVRNFQLLGVYPGTHLYQVNPGVYSVEFTVTQICGDGTYTVSNSKLQNF